MTLPPKLTRPSSTVRRGRKKKPKNKKTPAVATLELKKLINRIACIQFGSLYQSVNCFSEDKPGWQRVFVSKEENPDQKITGE